MVNHVPAGTHTLTPHLVVKDAARAIKFYEKALGATELFHMDAPGGRIGHAELQLGDSRFYIADEMPGGSLQAPKQASVGLHVYVADCDALIQRAVSAGAKVVMPAMDMFWGDRYGQVRDPFGHVWSIATHKEDLSPDEIARRGKEAMAQMAPPPAAKPKAKAKAKPKAKPKKSRGK
jgi:PhnB protein